MEVSSLELVARWRKGDSAAAQALFERYTQELLRVARRHLPAALAARVDPEDVVQSAYRSFFADALTDRYVLERSGDLWSLLAAITIHKAQRQVEMHTAAKRAVSRERAPAGTDSMHGVSVDHLAQSPSPSEAVAVVDELETVLRDFSPNQQRMVEMRLQGHTFEAIAEAVDCSERFVRRVMEQLKLRLKQRCEAFAIA